MEYVAERQTYCQNCDRSLDSIDPQDLTSCQKCKFVVCVMCLDTNGCWNCRIEDPNNTQAITVITDVTDVTDVADVASEQQQEPSATGGDFAMESESGLLECKGGKSGEKHLVSEDKLTQFGTCVDCFAKNRSEKTFIKDRSGQKKLNVLGTVKENIKKAQKDVLEIWEQKLLEPLLNDSLNGDELYYKIRGISMSKHQKNWRTKLNSSVADMDVLFSGYGCAAVMIGYHPTKTGGDHYEVVGAKPVLDALEASEDFDKNGKKTSNKWLLARNVIEQKLCETYPRDKIIPSLLQSEIASKLLASLHGLKNLQKPKKKFSLSAKSSKQFDRKILKALDGEDEGEEEEKDEDEEEEMGEEADENANDQSPYNATEARSQSEDDEHILEQTHAESYRTQKSVFEGEDMEELGISHETPNDGQKNIDSDGAPELPREGEKNTDLSRASLNDIANLEGTPRSQTSSLDRGLSSSLLSPVEHPVKSAVIMTLNPVIGDNIRNLRESQNDEGFIPPKVNILNEEEKSLQKKKISRKAATHKDTKRTTNENKKVNPSVKASKKLSTTSKNNKEKNPAEVQISTKPKENLRKKLRVHLPQIDGHVDEDDVMQVEHLLDVSETGSEAWSMDVLASDTESLRLADLDLEDSVSVARSDDTTRSDPADNLQREDLTDYGGGTLTRGAVVGDVPRNAAVEQWAELSGVRNAGVQQAGTRRDSDGSNHSTRQAESILKKPHMLGIMPVTTVGEAVVCLDDSAVTDGDQPIRLENPKLAGGKRKADDLRGSPSKKVKINNEAGTLLFSGTTLCKEGEFVDPVETVRLNALRNIKIKAVNMGSISPFCFAITEDEKVYAWGMNEKGQLGLGDTDYRKAPTLVEELTGYNIIEIATGRSHTLFLSSEGKVLACGDNSNGQCGVGKEFPQINTPKLMTYRGPEVVHVTCGGDFSVILDKIGNIYSCGLNLYGQLGKLSLEANKTQFLNDTPKQILVFVEKDLKSKDINRLPIPKIVIISCGTYHTVAIDDKLKAYSWGFGGYGQLGHVGTSNELLPRRIQAFNGPQQGISDVVCSQQFNVAIAEITGVIHDLSGRNIRCVACNTEGWKVLVDKCILANCEMDSTKGSIANNLEGIHIIKLVSGPAHDLFICRDNEEKDRQALEKFSWLEQSKK